MRKRTKIILLIAGAARLIVCDVFLCEFIFAFLCCSSKTVKDIDAYKALYGTDHVCPALPPDAMLGNYESAAFYYNEVLAPISNYRSYSVTLYYDEERYAAQKTYVNENKRYVETAGINTGGYEPSFTCGGFRFQTEQGLIFPKRMDFIGFNDDENAICFIHFEDWELDGCSDFPQELTERGLVSEK